MNPTEITDEHEEYWAGYSVFGENRLTTFLAPDDPPGCEACPGIITPTPDGPVVRVAWAITDEEIEALKESKTLWLSTWGGLPAHSIEVHGWQVTE